MKRTKTSEIVGLIFTIIVGIISIYIGATDPDISIIILVSIMFGLIVYWINDFIVTEAKRKIQQINDNSNEIKNINNNIQEIKSKLNYYQELSELKVKVESIMKSNKRKAVVDPRIVTAIVIIIMLLFLLRSAGYF